MYLTIPISLYTAATSLGFFILRICFHFCRVRLKTLFCLAMANELHLIALECKLLLVKFDVPLPSPIQERLKISVVDFIGLSLCFSLTCDQYILSFQILVKFHLKNLWGWGDSEGHSVPAIAPPPPPRV